MAVFEEGFLRAVAFAEHQMPGDAKTCFTPGLQEEIGFGPAVEAYAEGMALQRAIHLGKGRFEPISVVVVADGTPVAGFVMCDVGWIGDDQVGAAESGRIGSADRRVPKESQPRRSENRLAVHDGRCANQIKETLSVN